MKETRKALNFDLSDILLQEHYDKNYHMNAWSDIRKYLEKNGFEHRQYSGYVSKTPMSINDVNLIVASMSIKYP